MDVNKFWRKYKILNQTVIFSVSIILISAIHNSAQSIIIKADDDSDGQICGKIENGQLTIPSYKFRVTDKNGNLLNNLRTDGELHIEQSIYTKNGFFDLDPYYRKVNQDIKIPVIFDPKEGLYSNQEVQKVTVIKRKKCLSRVIRLSFNFYQNYTDSTSFIFFFPNKTADKINLPSTEKVYNLGIP